jgi:hypothetical protein
MSFKQSISVFYERIAKFIDYFVPRNDAVNLGLLFLLSHIFILFNRSIGWDGYALLNAGYADLKADFRTYGLSDFYPILHYQLVNLTNDPVFTYNLTAFLFSLINTFLTYFILKRLETFTRNEVFVISILCAVLPYLYFNLIGISAVILYAFFLAGTLFLIIYKSSRVLIYRIVSLILLFIAFQYNSHVSFYLIVLVIIWIKKPPGMPGLRYALKHLDFILLPVIYVIYQRLNFYYYEGPKDDSYNTFVFNSFLWLPKNLLASFQHSFFELFALCAEMLSKFYVVFIILFFMPYIARLLRHTLKETKFQTSVISGKPFERHLILLLIGIFLFLLGAFPFSLVFKYPDFVGKGAADMHQCNLYLGTAFIIYSIVMLAIDIRFKIGAFALIISCLIFVNINNFIVNTQQWLKEESLLTHFQSNPVFSNNQTFLIDDYARDLNASFRLQIYTLNGLMNRAFNNQSTRLGITREELFDFIRINGYDNPLRIDTSNATFGMQNYKKENFDYNIIIEKGDLILTDFGTLKLLALHFLDRKKFEKEVKSVVDIKVLSCTDCPTLQ